MFFAVTCIPTVAQHGSSEKSLNDYVEFLNHASDEIAGRFNMVRAYQADLNRHIKKRDYLLRLPSSGPLEAFYYHKALASKGLTPAEKLELNAATNSIWGLLGQLDQTGKALETYVRLKDYQSDSLKQSELHIARLQLLFRQFRSEKTAFYQKIKKMCKQ